MSVVASTIPLSQKLTARMGNVEGLTAAHFVQLSARMEHMPVRLSLMAINTTIPIVLWYPFIASIQPMVDWKQRLFRIERMLRVFQTKALSTAVSYQMTCQVVRVSNVGEKCEEVQVENQAS